MFKNSLLISISISTMLAVSAEVPTQQTELECIYKNLSYKFDFKVIADKKPLGDTTDNITKIRLLIYPKRWSKPLQVIDLDGGLLYDTVFTDRRAARSYVTGYKKNAEIADYDFGDLIIADLNFDGKEDIAIKYDSGGNGGPYYNFYLQNTQGKFKLDRFLTDSVGSFPQFINSKNRTITTQIHANVKYESQKTFHYCSAKHKWHLTKWKMVKAVSN